MYNLKHTTIKKISKLWASFIDEVKGFCWVIGLRTDAQRIAIGLALTIGLLMACSMGEALQRMW